RQISGGPAVGGSMPVLHSAANCLFVGPVSFIIPAQCSIAGYAHGGDDEYGISLRAGVPHFANSFSCASCCFRHASSAALKSYGALYAAPKPSDGIVISNASFPTNLGTRRYI